MHILLFFSGFLPKGSQRLARQLLNCLFAANTQGINYSFLKILLSLFFTALGLKLTTLHMHTHIHTCMHACTCMLNMLNMDASMLAAICNFYTCINVHVCMCVHVHVCGDTPQAPRCPQPPTPSPRATGSPKHQNSISPELIEIIQLCLKVLYL